MASVEECERAFHGLADQLKSIDPAERKNTTLDRSLSCSLPDIGVIFGARLHNGELTDIRRVDDAAAQVKLRMNSDELMSLVAGDTSFAKAWSSGRVKIDAKVFDLIKLRSIF